MTECSPAKTREYPRIFSNFQNVCCEKDFSGIWYDSLHLRLKIYMLQYLSFDTVLPFCYLKLTVLLKLHSWKTVRLLGQIMSDNKYPSIFLHQMEAIVYVAWHACPVISHPRLSPWAIKLKVEDD